MTVKKLVAASAGVALLVALVAVLGRSRETDEEKLRRVVDELAEAASRRDVAEVLDHVSEGFQGGKRGVATKEQLRGLLLGVLLRQGWSRVYVLDASFRPAEGGGYDGDVVFVGAQGQELPDDVRQLSPTRVQAYRVSARFLAEEGDWRIVEADYAPLDATGLFGGG